MKQKCIVMLSGGLDSRLAVKLMQEKGFEVIALHYRFPFSKNVVEEVRRFCEEQSFADLKSSTIPHPPRPNGGKKKSNLRTSIIKLKIIDCTKGKLFRDYLDVVRKPKHHCGVCLNPCVDCRIFALKNAKEFADEEGIKFIATGEVEGQRPMSQMKKSMRIVEEESDLSGRLLRPVSEITSGRRRDKQMNLAKKFKISYPSSGGGCLLCEKLYCEKLKKILGKKDLNFKDIELLKIGRHFEGSKIIIGRDKRENDLLEKEKGVKVIPKQPGPSALIRGGFARIPQLTTSHEGFYGLHFYHEIARPPNPDRRRKKSDSLVSIQEKELVEKAKKLIQKYSKHEVKGFEVRE